MEVGAPAAVFVYIVSPSPTPTDSMKFVEYDQRAHRLETLANFAFWVQSMSLVFAVRVQTTDLLRYSEGPPESQNRNTTTRTWYTSKTACAFSAIDRFASQRLSR